MKDFAVKFCKLFNLDENNLEKSHPIFKETKIIHNEKGNYKTFEVIIKKQEINSFFIDFVGLVKSDISFEGYILQEKDVSQNYFLENINKTNFTDSEFDFIKDGLISIRFCRLFSDLELHLSFFES